jgi:hypothetical protein
MVPGVVSTSLSVGIPRPVYLSVCFPVFLRSSSRRFSLIRDFESESDVRFGSCLPAGRTNRTPNAFFSSREALDVGSFDRSFRHFCEPDVTCGTTQPTGHAHGVTPCTDMNGQPPILPSEEHR